MVYKNLVEARNAHLVATADLNSDKFDLMNLPGSLPYLAMVSHSLSYTFMTDKVKTTLASTFASRELKKNT